MVGYYWHGITYGFDHYSVLSDSKDRHEYLISTHSVNTIFVVSQSTCICKTTLLANPISVVQSITHNGVCAL